LTSVEDLAKDCFKYEPKLIFRFCTIVWTLNGVANEYVRKSSNYKLKTESNKLNETTSDSSYPAVFIVSEWNTEHRSEKHPGGSVHTTRKLTPADEEKML